MKFHLYVQFTKLNLRHHCIRRIFHPIKFEMTYFQTQTPLIVMFNMHVHISMHAHTYLHMRKRDSSKWRLHLFIKFDTLCSSCAYIYINHKAYIHMY